MDFGREQLEGQKLLNISAEKTTLHTGFMNFCTAAMENFLDLQLGFYYKRHYIHFLTFTLHY